VPLNVGSTLAGFSRFFFNESGDDPPLKRSVFYVQLAVVVCVCVLVSQGCVEKNKLGSVFIPWAESNELYGPNQHA